MLRTAPTVDDPRTRLDRLLSLFTDVRAGEGTTALLMLANIFVLLVCYAIIKTVREPLILLGGGAEVRSYAAAGQALLLMGVVPLYGWFAARVGRAALVVGVTLSFIAGLALFAAAVRAGVPYVGVAFFIWVGIFNVSLIAQFWSFANDIYTREAGGRLFPVIVMGMTAGAPLGSFVAARLFRFGLSVPAILSVAAALLATSAVLYLRISRRGVLHATPGLALPSSTGGFGLVLGNSYLRRIALLVVLLNVVNTTGEYMVARLLASHAAALAAANPGFDRQAFIGAFSGDYQFVVNVVALLLQAFVTARLVKYRGLAGVLLALPLIALGGYAIVAAGVGFSVVRWVKTAENATDYSIMNTARQLLWLPTSRDDKYKAKQAIDTFFVRAGDVLSALAVYVGAHQLHLGVEQFAAINVVLTLAWIGVALGLLAPRRVASAPLGLRPLARVAVGLAVCLIAAPVFAQESREGELAALRAEKATRLHPYEPTPLEQRLERVERFDSALFAKRPVYPFIGTIVDGGGLAVGPGVQARYGETGVLDAHAVWSVRNYKDADVALRLPTFAHGRMAVNVRANWLDAPSIGFYGTGNDSVQAARTSFAYTATTVGVSTRFQASRLVAVGGGLDAVQIETGPATGTTGLASADPTYRRAHLFAELDSRTSPGYTKRGGLYRVEWSDYRQTNTGAYSFRRVDAEVQQFVPVLRESWIIALRALASSTDTGTGQDVPYFLMPDLGGSHTLRGYPAWRFRDRNRLLFTGEYRWTAGPLVDMALFVDAGKVAPRAAGLDLGDLTKTYGLGISFHTPSTTVTRIEVARTGEGTSLVFSFSPSF